MLDFRKKFFRKLLSSIPEKVVPEVFSGTTSSRIGISNFRKKFFRNMDEDQWTYDCAMSQEVDMDYDYDNEEECGVNEPRVDCSNAFNKYLVLEMMFCSGLEQLPMKMDLLQ
ncbi:hypothetical protein GmHk_18G051954 [Glycine max]|nr:hypothetical protein GmHk_18G051954 [Glycine max]